MNPKFAKLTNTHLADAHGDVSTALEGGHRGSKTGGARSTGLRLIPKDVGVIGSPNTRTLGRAQSQPLPDAVGHFDS